MLEESLSFTLRPAVTHDDLMKACAVRAAAYGNRDPAYREAMAVPDAIDASPWTTVFLCEDKSTRRAVGTMRIQTGARGSGQVELEKYVQLPERIATASRAEITRLSAVLGADPFVRLALWKVGYQTCVEQGIRWLVMGVRKPALIRAYEKMGARDVFEDGHAVPLAYAKNLPHRVFALDVEDCPRYWESNDHPLLDFMTRTVHRDIVSRPLVHRDATEQIGLHVLQ
jgi:hypothetical protein